MDSVPLQDAVGRLHEVFGPVEGLIPTLEADALVARASTGELKACLPRLLALTSAGELGSIEPYEVFGLLGSWHDWPPRQRNAVFGWADAWWLTALSDHPGPVRATDVLGELTHLGAPMIRWLEVWRDHLDGPGALHLADAVLRGEETDAWAKSADSLGQLVAWAESEPIILGLTLVGGPHLRPGELGDVLDILL